MKYQEISQEGLSYLKCTRFRGSTTSKQLCSSAAKCNECSAYFEANDGLLQIAKWDKEPVVESNFPG